MEKVPRSIEYYLGVFIPVYIVFLNMALQQLRIISRPLVSSYAPLVPQSSISVARVTPVTA